MRFLLAVWQAPRFNFAFGMLSLVLGIVLILGGKARVSVESYTWILERGGPVVWGISFVVLGTGLLLSADRLGLQKWLLVAGAAGYLMFASMFLVAAIIYPNANLTAIVAYTWISAMHACAARSVFRLDRQQEIE